MYERGDCDRLQEQMNGLYKKIDILHDNNLFYITALNLSGKRYELEKLAMEQIENKGKLQALRNSRRSKK